MDGSIYFSVRLIARLKPGVLRRCVQGACVVAVLASVFAVSPVRAADGSTHSGRSGQAVFGTKCSACHSYGMRGAPKISDAAAWAPRLAQGTEALYEHTLKGFGWMPSRGSCSACSDDEVKAAVDYMLSKIPK